MKTLWKPLPVRPATIPSQASSKSSSSDTTTTPTNADNATVQQTYGTYHGYSSDNATDNTTFNNYLQNAQNLTHANVSSPADGRQPAQAYIDGLYEDDKISEAQWARMLDLLGL